MLQEKHNDVSYQSFLEIKLSNVVLKNFTLLPSNSTYIRRKSTELVMRESDLQLAGGFFSDLTCPDFLQIKVRLPHFL